MTAIYAHASDRFCDPGRVSGEQSVVFRSSGKFYKAQLHNEMVHKLLDFFFCKGAILEIPLGVDIQESGGSSKRHGSAVLLLDCGQIAEIQPLNGLLNIGSRSGDIETIDISKLFQLF